nr:PREDICTED: zinc-binding protein A33-like [Latimeria chalumnae]|eukprot:XP_014345241.1 PREDICTED: zinc-binding protein A33-like [Latimeria chalumnae]
MREVMDCPVLDSIAIDPKTTYPELIVSEDGTSVQWSRIYPHVPNNPERFMWTSAALGCEGFTSGRHYWAVEVGDESVWSLGMVRESVERKTRTERSPANGFYCLSKLKEDCVYCPQWKRLPLPVKPRRIAIYLDYEGGQVSFYNAENMSHIHTYTDTFTERMYPFFNTWCNSAPLKIVVVNG